MPVVLGGLLIPFFIFAAAIVLIGIAQTHTAAHGSHDTGGFWKFLTLKGQVQFWFGLSVKAGRYVASHFAAAMLRPLARWFMGMGTLTGGLFAVQAEFAEAIVHAVERVLHRGDPKARHKAQTAQHTAVHAGHVAHHANVHARSVGHALDAHKARVNPQIRRLTHETTVALPRDIWRVKHRERWAERQLWKLRDRVKGIEDGAIKTWEWITDHPFSAATGAFVGAVALALGRLGLDAIRCPSLGRVFGKRGCGMWDDLDDLLGLAVLAVGVLEFETLVRTAQDLTEEGVQDFKDVFGL